MTFVAGNSSAARAAYESRTVAVKELIQVGNRVRFHVEGAATVGLISGLYVVTLLAMTQRAEGSLQMMATMGREAFMGLSWVACGVLSLVALAAASGIIRSEITGRRIDLLRVTSLSLETIVLGKGAAVFMRAVATLVLLMPVMAAAQLIGGVMLSDFIKSVAIILGNVFIFTCIGLAVSGGARSAFAIGFRALLFLVAWMILCHAPMALNFLWMAVFSPRFPSLLGFGVFQQCANASSPFTVWILAAHASLTWFGLGANLAVNLVGGVWFMWLTPRMLTKNLRTSDIPREEPKVRAVVSVKRLSVVDSLSKKGKRRVASWWSGFPGTLVGGQILQSNLFAIMLPVGLFVGMFPSYLGMVVSGESYSAQRDAASWAAMALSLVVVLAVIIEASSMIAREKARRTAELIATTPAGGPYMAVWKGQALFASQIFGIAAALAFIAMRFATAWAIPSHGFVLAADFLGLLLLAYSAGISFSLSSRSPGTALLSVAMTLFVLGPMAAMALDSLGVVFVDSGYFDDHNQVKLAAFVMAIALLVPIVLRNYFDRAAGVVLAVALALATAGFDICLRSHAFSGSSIFIYAYMLGAADPSTYVSLAFYAAIWQAVVAVAMLAGVPIRFNSQLLQGARARG
jgi:hypothetical protein